MNRDKKFCTIIVEGGLIDNRYGNFESSYTIRV